jgi:hypothetical protein
MPYDHLECVYCLRRWPKTEFMVEPGPHCKGTMNAPGPCPNCENDSGFYRFLGRDGNEEVRDCHNHRPGCECPTKVEHRDDCPEFWPGGLRRS